MKIKSIAFGLVAAMTASAAFAEAPALKAAEPQPAACEQKLVDEITVGMREVLRAVTPEISLPKVEVKLPTLAARRS